MEPQHNLKVCVWLLAARVYRLECCKEVKFPREKVEVRLKNRSLRGCLYLGRRGWGEERKQKLS